MLTRIEEGKVNKLKLETEIQQLETYDPIQDPEVAADTKILHAEKKKEVHTYWPSSSFLLKPTFEF